jgi:hypothetical protein
MDAHSDLMARRLRRAGRHGLLLAALAVTAPVQATTAELQRCRPLTDAAARLACYDAIAVAPGAAAGGSPSSAAPAPAAPATAAGANAIAMFGLQQTRPAEPEAIESSFADGVESWRGGSRLQLANGQVWQVTDDSRGFVPPDARKVRVRRGALGAYFLEIKGTNFALRVRRVK